MTETKQSTTVASGLSLLRINNVIGDKEMAQLKFFAMVMNAPLAKVEKVTRVSELLDVLNGQHTRKKAAALLQSMLSVIEVDVHTVALLGSAQEDLEAIRKLDEFTFGKLMITVCQELGDLKPFADLKDVLKNELSMAPAKIESPEQLLLMLIRGNKLSETNLHLLSESLEGVHLDKLAGDVKEFRQQNNSITQETEQGTCMNLAYVML